MNIAKKCIVALGIMCLVFGAMYSVCAADELKTIDDPEGDVMAMDDLYETEEYNFTDEKPNIDIEKVTYEHNDGANQATLTIQVYGEIENRGSLGDDITEALNSVIYNAMVYTSEGLYDITYVNQKCQVIYPDETTQNITGFTVDGGTLEIKLDLTKSDETYEEMAVTTSEFKLDLSEESYYVYFDFAFEGLEIVADAGGPYEGEAGEPIQFEGQAEYLPPQLVEEFEFSWDFGDGTTSSQQNPTHSYDEAGNYTATLTVTDEAESVDTDTVKVTITDSSSGNGQSNGESNTGLLLFIAIIAIIVIIGIVVLVLIIRR